MTRNEFMKLLGLGAATAAVGTTSSGEPSTDTPRGKATWFVTDWKYDPSPRSLEFTLRSNGPVPDETIDRLRQAIEGREPITM